MHSHPALPPTAHSPFLPMWMANCSDAQALHSDVLRQVECDSTVEQAHYVVLALFKGAGRRDTDATPQNREATRREPRP